jgi:hypothetical protein
MLAPTVANTQATEQAATPPPASPVASPIASQGITWPADQALPTFPEATSLTVVNIENVSDSEKVLFSTLQGIVNRTTPRIYLEQPRDEGAYTWLRDGLDLPYEEIDDPWALIDQFKSEIAGIVVTDPAISHTVNVATTIAGLQGGIVAAPAHVERLKAEPYNLTVIDDLQGRFASNLEANTWQVENLWPEVSHRMLLGIDPEGVVADLRDYAIANTTMPFWLDVNVPEEQELFLRLLQDVDPYTPYLGWFSQDVAGEFSGTQLCSEHSVYVLAADWFSNMTVWSGTRAPEIQAQTVPPPLLDNKIYVTFVYSEGDNLQYNEHRLRVLWDDAGRGSIPINWTTNPLLVDAAPAMLAWFVDSATENDHFMVGPSGAGYINPGPWPDGTFDLYTQRTGAYMRATGMNTIYVLNRDNGEGIALTDAEVTSYEENADPKGIMLNWENRTESSWLTGGMPQTIVHQGGTVGEIQSAIATAAEGWDGQSPLFLAMGVLAWDLTPTDIATIAGSLGSDFVVVRADQYFDLMRAYGGGGSATPAASPGATPAS